MVHDEPNSCSRTGDGPLGCGPSDGRPTDDAGCSHPPGARDVLGIDGENVYHRCERCGSLVIVALPGGEDGGV